MSFKNSMIILTSNIGSRIIAASSTAGREAGAFARPRRGADVDEIDERIAAVRAHKLKQEVLAEVRSFFSPELLNR